MEIILIRMIVVALYIWFPCRWLGKLIGVGMGVEEDSALDLTLYCLCGAAIHLLVFFLFFICGGYAYFQNCGGH